MRRVESYFGGHLLAGVAALAIAYAMGGRIIWALAFVLLGSFWVYSHLRAGRGFETIFFFVYAVAAAIGYWIALHPLLLLLALVVLLGAWDLDHFAQRLRLVNRVELNSGLAASHLQRLLLVEFLGVLAGLAALTSSFTITFWVQVLLVIVAVIVISRLVIMVRKDLGE